jgi:LAO/AO transport system kinase
MTADVSAGPLDALRAGGKPALARALARIEARPDDPDTHAVLDAAWAAPCGHALGLTGPPGVGKSTLIDALIRVARPQGLTVGVIAVDPSSRISGGALLGDRTRFSIDPEDRGVLVRSMAARDRLGGLAEITWPALVLMRALHDLVIVETVGVGQSETEIVDIADTVVFCAQPGSGDALQFMKAGVMEIPHIVVVTKGDMGVIADRAVADLRGALSLAAPGHAEVPVLRCAAATNEGVDAVLAAVHTRRAAQEASGDLARTRAVQMRAWARRAVIEAYGRRGFACVAADLESVGTSPHPFLGVAKSKIRLERALSVGFAQQ